MEKTSYQKMNEEFLLIKDKLGEDKVFFHFEPVRDSVDDVLQFGCNLMAMLELNTWTGFTNKEVEMNETNGARCRLMAVRLSDMCEGAIERLQEIQIKLKEISNADANRKTKTKTTKFNGSEHDEGKPSIAPEEV